MTKKRYVVYLVVSGIFTLALLVKLCPLFPSNLYVVLDLIAMLGGGVFCSTLVSWFVEAQNKKREIQSQEKQREYILASVKSSFLRLYERELHEFSGYYNKYIAKNSANWVREELQITAIAQKLTWLINKFEEEKNNESSSEVITISLDYLKHRDDQNRALVSRNQLYYKSLHKHLLELSSHYSTYLISGIFSEQQIDAYAMFLPLPILPHIWYN